jgi:hypothetical protein
MKCVHIDDSTLNAIKFAKTLMKRTIESVPASKSEMSSELMAYMKEHTQRLADLINAVDEADEI